ncbi:MAG: NADH-quinone oxidoreductase subunit C [Phototrophicaceae bacterium]
MQIPAALDPVEEVKNNFSDAVLHVKEFRGETTIIVDSASIVDVMLFLRSTPGLVYNFLSDISAVDYYPNDYGSDYDGSGNDFRPERYGVSYHLYSMLYNRRLRVKTFAIEEEPIIPTLTTNWPAANWLEREIADLMGVAFEGHPDPRRLLMSEDWDGHPHRRDYPLGKETIAFSFNVAEIRKHKPRAED